MIFSLGSAAGYIEGVVLAIGVGYLLDNYHESWRWMFPVSAMIGIGGVFLQSRIPMEIKKVQLPFELEGVERPKSVGEYLLKPWKNAWELLKARKDFSCYQWGVMLCGIGIMIIQPALPLFFVDVLKLSYTDLAIALSICKGFWICSNFSGLGEMAAQSEHLQYFEPCLYFDGGLSAIASFFSTSCLGGFILLT